MRKIEIAVAMGIASKAVIRQKSIVEISAPDRAAAREKMPPISLRRMTTASGRKKSACADIRHKVTSKGAATSVRSFEIASPAGSSAMVHMTAMPLHLSTPS